MTTTETYEHNLNETVRMLKRAAGVHDSDIAERLGISRTVVQQRVSGRSQWKPGEIGALADFFGVDQNTLYKPGREAVLEAIENLGLLERFPDQPKDPFGWMDVQAA